MEPTANSGRTVSVDLDHVGLAVGRPVGIEPGPSKWNEVPAGSGLVKLATDLNALGGRVAILLRAVQPRLRVGARGHRGAVVLGRYDPKLHAPHAIDIHHR